MIHLSELKVVPLWMPVSEQVGKGTGGPPLLQSSASRAAWLCCNTVESLPSSLGTSVLKTVPAHACLCPLLGTGAQQQTEAHFLGKLLLSPVGAARHTASCCSHNCWHVLNCMGYLVQMPWSGFVIMYVILANVKWFIRAELQQLQTCTSFKTVPWYGLVLGQSCAGILPGWRELEMGSHNSVGRLLPWVAVADDDRTVLQVPGRASAASESKTAAF